MRHYNRAAIVERMRLASAPASTSLLIPPNVPQAGRLVKRSFSQRYPTPRASDKVAETGPIA